MKVLAAYEQLDNLRKIQKTLERKIKTHKVETSRLQETLAQEQNESKRLTSQIQAAQSIFSKSSIKMNYQGITVNGVPLTEKNKSSFAMHKRNSSMAQIPTMDQINMSLPSVFNSFSRYPAQKYNEDFLTTGVSVNRTEESNELDQSVSKNSQGKTGIGRVLSFFKGPKLKATASTSNLLI